MLVSLEVVCWKQLASSFWYEQFQSLKNLTYIEDGCGCLFVRRFLRAFGPCLGAPMQAHGQWMRPLLWSKRRQGMGIQKVLSLAPRLQYLASRSA